MATSTPTEESVREVKKYMAMKDFYEILGVSKDSNEQDVKKAYRKLALKFHPDKNKTPGAAEVFKKVAQAYDCLSNADKRAKYDQYGNEEPEQHYRHYQQSYHDDIDPNDIFNFFFGGSGFFDEVHQRNGNGFYYSFNGRPRGYGANGNGQHQQQHQQQQRRGGAQPAGGNYMQLIQLLPILLLMFSGLFANFFREDPLYSLQKTQYYNSRRETQTLHMSYYVGQNFQSKKGDPSFVRQIEYDIEVQQVQNMRQQCQNTQYLQRQLEYQKRTSSSQRDKDYYDYRIRSLDFTFCTRLTEYKEKIPNFDRVYR